MSIKVRPALWRSASMIAVMTFFGSGNIAFAQDTNGIPTDDETGDEIIVSGIRASLDRSIDIKRESTGIVDGISAEDIGKFPDTNLAESLQRVTGVSIDRVNGEGSQVTVRGFGPGYNLVTLNGRTLPTASIASVGRDQGGDFVSGTSRSFDFNNIASEGVSRLEVYKTARAAIPSGGIGAAINIVTRRPLDSPAGFTGSLGGKLVVDATDTYDYDRITHEASGLVNWTNAGGTFGIGLFAAYQKRNNSAVSEDANDWNIETFADFSDPTRGRVKSDGTTIFNNAPSGDTLVAFPNDTRYHYSEFSRERINGQLTLQFAPTDTIRVTADGTFYQNDAEERRADQTTWYNRPFEEVTFDGNDQVATTTFLDDIITAPKDGGFENQYRGTRDRLYDVGLNIEFKPTDRITLIADGHHGVAESLPNNPLGNTSTIFSIAQKGIIDQQLTIVDGFPRESITFSDADNGNNNGILDVADLGTQVARTITSRQKQTINEARLDGAWEFGDDDRINFGGTYREASMDQNRVDTYQALGDWGVGNIGDVEQFAPGLTQTFCLTCKFNDYDAGQTGAGLIAFRGDATALYNAIAPNYPGFGTVNGNQNNQVDEKIWAAYAQIDYNINLAGRNANLTAGLRYEHTDSTSTSLIAIPQAIVWSADNDFTTVLSADAQPVTGTNTYDHFLPAIDFSINITSDVKGRLSYGHTIARPDFGSLFAASSPGAPNRPTAIGGVPGGSAGNPQLVPLLSKNIDASLEWYFARSSYLSVGFFDKRVKNFVGVGQTTTDLFGLRDPSSGQAGTRSGQAAEYLRTNGYDLSDVNLFTLTALIDNFGLANATQQFQANLTAGGLSQTFVDQILGAYDVTANGDDPLYQFQLTQPVNNKEGHIYGFEVAGQYFLGETGFGVAAAYTLVRGDVGYDITASPTSDQFALLGLSDTANASLIFERFGLSARLTYNWRDRFLANNSRGSSRNPVYVKPYDQLDLNVSYDLNEQVSLSFEGINLTGSNVETYARTENEPWSITDISPRYYFGMRFRF